MAVLTIQLLSILVGECYLWAKAIPALTATKGRGFSKPLENSKLQHKYAYPDMDMMLSVSNSIVAVPYLLQ